MEILNAIRKRTLISGKNLEISVSGYSMQPLINDGDMILLTYSPKYVVGDVIVFEYEGNILVHRILKIDNGYVCCKGDNSFRLEKVAFSEIIGKVESVNGEKLNPISIELINLSYCIGCDFENNKSIEKTKKQGNYKKYQELMEHKKVNCKGSIV